MTFNETSFECKCDRCSHSWRARTSEPPKKCPSCTSILWNSGTRKFQCIISRACEKDENGDGRKFCIIEYVDKPDITTEDMFYIKPDDMQRYLKNARMPAGSAVIFVGDLEIGENKVLNIKELKLVYCHERAFRVYGSLNCIYNIQSFHEKQKAEKLRKEEAARQAIREEERKKAMIEAAKQKLEIEAEKQRKLEIAKQKIADDSTPIDEKIKLLAEIQA